MHLSRRHKKWDVLISQPHSILMLWNRHRGDYCLSDGTGSYQGDDRVTLPESSWCRRESRTVPRLPSPRNIYSIVHSTLRHQGTRDCGEDCVQVMNLSITRYVMMTSRLFDNNNHGIRPTPPHVYTHTIVWRSSGRRSRVP